MEYNERMNVYNENGDSEDILNSNIEDLLTQPESTSGPMDILADVSYVLSIFWPKLDKWHLARNMGS